MLRDKVTEFFVKLDDFQQEFTKNIEDHPKLLDTKVKRRNRKGKLSDSEMMSIYLLFHFGQFTNFKHFYLQYVWFALLYWTTEIPLVFRIFMI